jgi:RHS repeat-associated protein
MPAGQKIKMYYDPLGRVVRTVNPDASEQRVVFGMPLALDTPTSYSPTPWESYTYDAEDLDVSSDHYATPKSAVVDALGRSVKTIDRLVSNNEAGDNVRMLYEYDIRGNLLEVTDALNRKVFEYVYDLRPPAKEGESIPPLKTVHIDKGTSTVVFDCMGKPLQGDDAKGARTLSAYDELMRPTDAWARDVTGEDITLRLHLIYGTDASVDVNTKGKLYEQYDEAGYQRMDSYDFKGNLLHKFRQVIADSELLSVFDGPPAGWEVTPYRVDWTGLPSILVDEAYHTDMAYDALNRIMTLTYPQDTDSTRKVLTPTYNKAGALFSVNLDGTDYVKEIAYNAKGQRLLIALGNDWMTRYTYDPVTFRLQRLKTEEYSYSATSTTTTYEPQSGSTRQDFAYTYDWVGNILSINNETPACGVGGSGSLLREFDYDALYRLISGTGRENKPTPAFPGWDDTTRSDTAGDTTAYTQYYSYDRMGNFDEFQHVASSSPDSFTRTFDYVSNKNLLDSITIGSNSYSFDYDNNGNLITENTERHFEWDYADQMRCFFNQTGTSEPTVYTQYLYAGGARVKKITRKSSGDKYVTVYIDGIFEHSYHLDGSNDMDEELNELHVMDDQTRVAMLRTGYDDGTPFTKYILSDHLGSSNVILETSGAVYNREEYYPFGETSFGAFGKKRYRYVGKEKDEESGLYYYGARYFQPWSCRFISVDPLAAKYAFYTPYQYAGNKPITKTDRDGLEETGSSPQQNNGVKPAGGEDKTYTTPGGQNITIPWSQYTGGKNIERVAPSNEVRELKKGGEVFVPEGSLTEFMINGTHYQSTYSVDGDKKTFVGYRDQNGNFYNPENGSENATDLGGGQAGNNATTQTNGSTTSATSEVPASPSDSAVTQKGTGSDSTTTPSTPSANNSDPIGDYYDPETTGFVLETGGLGSELIKKATEITEQTSSAAEKAREAQAFGKVSKIGKWAGRIGTAFTILSAAYETVNKLADTHTFVNVGLALTFFAIGWIVGPSLVLLGAAFAIGIAASIASDWIDVSTNHWGRGVIYGDTLIR